MLDLGSLEAVPACLVQRRREEPGTRPSSTPTRTAMITLSARRSCSGERGFWPRRLCRGPRGARDLRARHRPLGVRRAARPERVRALQGNALEGPRALRAHGLRLSAGVRLARIAARRRRGAHRRARHEHGEHAVVVDGRARAARRGRRGHLLHDRLPRAPRAPRPRPPRDLLLRAAAPAPLHDVADPGAHIARARTCASRGSTTR